VAIGSGALDATTTGVENVAIGTLYIRGLVVRGTALISYDPQKSVREDSASITRYFRRTKTISLPLENDGVFADAVGNYYLSRYKTPIFEVPSVALEDALATFGGVSPLSLEVGQIVALTETQTAISAQRYWVRGIETRLMAGGGECEMSLRVKRLDDVTYWILDDATYSVLETTTRLGL